MNKALLKVNEVNQSKTQMKQDTINLNEINSKQGDRSDSEDSLDVGEESIANERDSIRHAHSGRNVPKG